MKAAIGHYAVALFEATRGLKGKELDQVIQRFAKLLYTKRMLGKAPQIIRAYVAHSDTMAGEQEITVTSARPLDAAIQKRLATVFKKTTGKNIRLTTRTNPDQLGGLIVTIGDTIIDASLTRQLDSLQTSMSTTKPSVSAV